jgi:hypothetical protein
VGLVGMVFYSGCRFDTSPHLISLRRHQYTHCGMTRICTHAHSLNWGKKGFRNCFVHKNIFSLSASSVFLSFISRDPFVCCFILISIFCLFVCLFVCLSVCLFISNVFLGVVKPLHAVKGKGEDKQKLSDNGGEREAHSASTTAEKKKSLLKGNTGG